MLVGCGGGDKDLDDFLPPVPDPTGEAQTVYAGQIADSSELVDGPAAQGMIGDYYIRNDKARFIVQAATRVIGVVPQGGNLVDAVPVDADGNPSREDHFGELSMIYIAGRTCEHESVEVLRDGSGGGAAVLRARGHSGNNDFINLRGIGVLSIPIELDPDIEDQVDCATTYVLEPGSDHLRVSWTLFNGGDLDINGPFGTLSDTGGAVEQWAPTRGFERLGIDALTSAVDPAPVDFVLYQGPDVAYGMLPRHDDPTTTNSTFLIAGVSVFLFGAEKLLDILNEDFWHLHLKAGGGVTYNADLTVGFDAASATRVFYGDEATGRLSGKVTWEAAGTVPEGARVGFYQDTDGNGELGDDDLIITYADLDADGNFEGRVPPGNYLLRAEVKDTGRSAASAVAVAAGDDTGGHDLAIPDPVYVDYEITDFDTSNPVPAKLTVIGEHPAYPDKRVFETYDRFGGVVRQIEAIRGSTSLGADPDPRFALPAGSTYRIWATHGTQWSAASQVVTVDAGSPDLNLAFQLKQVAPADGYIASEYHVHQLGSPDSPVPNDVRVKTAIADGVQVFASSDHDFIGDLQPYVESYGMTDTLRVIPGIEVTPFAYGHFNAWPLEPDDTSPNKGAIDWARGQEGYAMLPGEIFAAMRERGASVVQVNHPRGGGIDFQQTFDRAGLTFDWARRMVDGDLNTQPVPNEWLRLPETSTQWSDDFDSLEVWNGFATADSNSDGVREIRRLDLVLRDWFNFLSLGMVVAPMGNSDSHTVIKDPMGMPRTYVKVEDDSALALSSGAVTDELIDTILGRDGTPMDIVVTDGPMIRVSASGPGGGSAIGRTIDASGSGDITFDIDVIAPEWAEIDTIEIFSNETLEVGRAADPSALTPRFCFTSRTTLAEGDPCNAAVGGARVLDVQLEDLGDGFSRWHATAQITIQASDIVAAEGATGSDAWFVVRAWGTRAIYPMLLNDVVADSHVDTLITGSGEAFDTLMTTTGVPAQAFTAPIYVDFDGDGYKAVFSPQ
ncbi:MAG TPA: CehA/McbA family metallohydrolase [Kofleriaceae bacterium]|nr:CehA/McbA family metallohydrolase [Kofleriaceae bacterium]